MILVNSAMMQKEIIQLLEENGFKHTKKQGLKLFFETPTEDATTDAAMAKQLIKGSSFGLAIVLIGLAMILIARSQKKKANKIEAENQQAHKDIKIKSRK